MLEQAQDCLRQLGARMLDWRRQAQGLSGEWQGAQLKTQADRWAHEFLNQQLGGGLPVLSEEDERHGAQRPDRYWLIDPIDGTASYAGGFSGFVTQAALMEAGVPVLGVVHAPALDLTFSARRGGPAICNGREIRVAADPGRRVLIDNYPQPRGAARLAHDALGCTGYVESGSIALKILRVADGTADLFLKDVEIRDWDVAAPLVVLEAAGGLMLAGDGHPWSFQGGWEKIGLVAANSRGLADEAAQWLGQRLREKAHGG